MFVFLCFLQKQEKPKFVLCVTFAENGDAITGDSSGNILVWGKGPSIYSYTSALVDKVILSSQFAWMQLTHGIKKIKNVTLRRH